MARAAGTPSALLHCDMTGVEDEQSSIASSYDVCEANAGRLRQRIDACRTGMEQLDRLRHKHQSLMKQMRLRLGLPEERFGDTKFARKISAPAMIKCVIDEQSASDVWAANCRRLDGGDGVKEERKTSSAVSHRSSMSVDSGCVSVTTADLPSASSSATLPPAICRTGPQLQKLQLSSSVHRDSYAAGPDEHVDSVLADDEEVPEEEEELSAGRSVLSCAIGSTLNGCGTAAQQQQQSSRRRSCDTELRKQAYLSCYPEENMVVVDSLHTRERNGGLYAASAVRPAAIGRSASLANCSRLPNTTRAVVGAFPSFRNSVLLNEQQRPAVERDQCAGDDVFRASRIFLDDEAQAVVAGKVDVGPSMWGNSGGGGGGVGAVSRRFRVVSRASASNVSVFVSSPSSSPSSSRTVRSSLSRSFSTLSSDSSGGKKRPKDWHESEKL